MKPTRLATAAALLAAMLGGCATQVTAAERGLIIKFKDDSAREAVMQREAGEHRVKLGAPRAMALGAWVYPVSGGEPDAFARELAADPAVDYVEWDDVATHQ
ncbi:hypothetical protein ACTSKR_01510 [Chitinibacteraceae bacterium HSL-7]